MSEDYKNFNYLVPIIDEVLANWTEADDEAAVENGVTKGQVIKDRIVQSFNTQTNLGTLPKWLYHHFDKLGTMSGWDGLDQDGRDYWQHEAAAVRRAVARGGYKGAGPEDSREVDSTIHIGQHNLDH